MAGSYRRVVTGLDKAGRSTVIVDGPPIASISVSGKSGLVWQTDAVPADNSGCEDISSGHISVGALGDGGTRFFIHEFPPRREGEPFWHATDTIDYITMLEGEVVLMTETGEVTLRRGDVLVDRGVRHAWRNDSDAPAVAAIVIIPGLPV